MSRSRKRELGMIAGDDTPMGRFDLVQHDAAPSPWGIKRARFAYESHSTESGAGSGSGEASGAARPKRTARRRRMPFASVPQNVSNPFNLKHGKRSRDDMDMCDDDDDSAAPPLNTKRQRYGSGGHLDG